MMSLSCLSQSLTKEFGRGRKEKGGLFSAGGKVRQCMYDNMIYGTGDQWYQKN